MSVQCNKCGKKIELNEAKQIMGSEDTYECLVKCSQTNVDYISAPTRVFVKCIADNNYGVGFEPTCGDIKIIPCG